MVEKRTIVIESPACDEPVTLEWIEDDVSFYFNILSSENCKYFDELIYFVPVAGSSIIQYLFHDFCCNS